MTPDKQQRLEEMAAIFELVDRQMAHDSPELVRETAWLIRELRSAWAINALYKEALEEIKDWFGHTDCDDSCIHKMNPARDALAKAKELEGEE